MRCNLSRVSSWLWNQIVWKKGDNTDILKHQNRLIRLLLFNNFRNRMNHIFPELLNYCMALDYSFNELVDEASLVGIAAIIPE